MIRKERTKLPRTLFYNEGAKYMKYIKSFGEMTVIAISDGKKMRSNWTQEVELEYLLVMLMTMLEMYTDS